MQQRTRLFILIASLLCALALAACGDSDSNDTPDTPTDTPASTSVPVITIVPSYPRLQSQYEALTAAHQAAAAIWEGLASGQQVQCGEPVEVPAPESITIPDDPALADIGEYLRAAAIDLDRAAGLWQAECNHPREVIPPETINEGRIAVRAAGDALRAAETRLNPPAP